VISETGAAGI